MIVDWIANVGALSFGALAYYFFARRETLQKNRPLSIASLGIIFGVLSALVVLMPVHIADGSTFDTRGGPAILAGYFLGPVGGLIAAGIASAARLWVGGPFVIGGALSPFVYMFFGVWCGSYCAYRKTGPSPLRLFAMAVLGTIVILPCFFVDQGIEVGFSVLQNAWYLLLLGNIAGVVILGTMVGEARRFEKEHSELKTTMRLADLARSSAGIAIWRFDMDANRLTWDEAMFKLFDVDPATFHGEFNDWEKTVHPKDLGAARAAFVTAYEHKSPFATEFRIILRDGTIRWITAHCDFVEDDDGKVVEAVGVNWDVTEEKTLAKKLAEQEQEARLRSEELEVTLASVVQGVSAFDADGSLRFCNTKVPEITGLSKDRLVPGVSSEDYNSYRAGAVISDFHNGTNLSLSGKDWPETHVRSLIHLTNGRILSFSAAPMPNGGWVETYEDVTEKAIADQRVKKAAETDTLTELANRLSFKNALDTALARAHREDAGDQFLLLIDLNDFKAVNDSFGHIVGDRLLKHVGDVLRTIVSGSDHAARLGGDEFALIVTSRTEADVHQIAKSLCTQFEAPVDLGGLVINSGLCVGIATILPSYTESEQILSRADLALYKAKAEKASTYRFYNLEIAEEEAERRQTKSALIQVVRDRGLDVYCQPILNLENKSVDHFEALVRWHKDDAHYLPPSNFIPLAEEIGLISEVGDFVLTEALKALSSWPDGLYACVNVSVLQLGNGQFVEKVISGLQAYGIPPHRLELEVTESVVMSAGSGAHEDLRKLRNAGLTLALDDFGTGFSSFGYLQDLPFNKLKIDRRFVTEVDTSEGSASILRTLAALARNLDMTCTAEGVENASQMDFVSNCGCHYAQGYFIGQPIPIDDVPIVRSSVPAGSAAQPASV